MTDPLTEAALPCAYIDPLSGGTCGINRTDRGCPPVGMDTRSLLEPPTMTSEPLTEAEQLRDWWDGLREIEQFDAYVIEKSNADALAAERERMKGLVEAARAVVTEWQHPDGSEYRTMKGLIADLAAALEAHDDR